MESASGSPDHHTVDGIIKPFVCIAGCGDQFNAVAAACYPKTGDDPITPNSAEACTEATAALRSCMQAAGGVYDSYGRAATAPDDLLPYPDPVIDGTINALLCIAGCDDKFEAAVTACYPDDPEDDETAVTPKPDVVACATAGAALRDCMKMEFKFIGGTD